jgi:hypothetical protein
MRRNSIHVTVIGTLLLVAASSACVHGGIVAAQSRPKTVTAAQTLDVAEEVTSAYMLFSSEVGVEGVVPATVLRLANKKSIILVGAYEEDEQPGELTVTGVVITKGGGVRSQTSPLEGAGAEGLSTLTARELQGRLAAGKASLAKLEGNKGQLAQELERLQQDADTIANIGKIVDAEDELGAVQNDEKRLAAGLAAAKAQLVALKAQPGPTNYQRREAELSAFLTEYARASRDATSDIFQKLASAEEEAARNQALIEETRYDHVDLLQKELISLKKERAAVERSRQVVVADRPAELRREEPPTLEREVPEESQDTEEEESEREE